VTEHANAQWLLSGDPLVNRSGAVVEVPGNHKSDGVWAERVKAVKYDARLYAGHNGARYSEFGQCNAT